MCLAVDYDIYVNIAEAPTSVEQDEVGIERVESCGDQHYQMTQQTQRRIPQLNDDNRQSHNPRVTQIPKSVRSGKRTKPPRVFPNPVR